MTPDQEEANDFLAVEEHLVARLKETFGGRSPAVHVLTAADLAEVTEAQQKTPAVHVIYGGFRPVESRRDGRVARLQHTWLAVAAVRNVRGMRDGSAARRDASVLMAQAGAVLMGFKPPGVIEALVLTPPPKPRYSAGFQYLPLAFLAETFFHASTP